MVAAWGSGGVILRGINCCGPQPVGSGTLLVGDVIVLEIGSPGPVIKDVLISARHINGQTLR